MALGRLKKRAEFLAVGATNRKWVTPGVIVQSLEQKPGATLRLGFTVSRKVGNAVIRNRARRRLRAAAAEIMENYVHRPYDIVLIGRAGTLARSWDELRGDLRFACKGLGIAVKPGSEP